MNILLLVFITNLFIAAVSGFGCYWQGYNRGKREGWIAGRSLLRVPVKNER